MSAANDLERIADHGRNIAYLAEMAMDDKLQISPRQRKKYLAFLKRLPR